MGGGKKIKNFLTLVSQFNYYLTGILLTLVFHYQTLHFESVDEFAYRVRFAYKEVCQISDS